MLEGMKIAILGAGALGCYYGARLAEAGHDVTFIVRSAYEAIRAQGLHVESVEGDIDLPEAHVCRTAQECGPADLVVVCWKAPCNSGFAEALPPLLHEKTEVITLQNGMGNAEAIAAFVPAERVFIGLCFVCCMPSDNPAVVRHLDGGNIRFAPLAADAAGEERAAFFAEMFRQARIKTSAHRHPEEILWTKLTWNIPFNGLCLAHGGIDTKQLFAMPGQVERARTIMEEVCAAAEKRGFPLSRDIVEWQMKRTEAMGAFTPSSAVDYLKHRPVEYDAIWGIPLARAKAAGVDVPEFEQLCADIRRRLGMPL